MRSKNLGELYNLPLVDWAVITDRLDQGLTLAPATGGPDHHTCWLATTNPDGSPHVTGIGAKWHADTFWFVTGKASKKGRNLARDPRCSISTATDEFEVVVEGAAELVEDPATVAKIAKLFADDGWPCQVDETGVAITAPFSAPSAGGPPWSVYRLTIADANALSLKEPGGATRWSFDSR
jgi:PPOX class probable F420-dependent enzyme